MCFSYYPLIAHLLALLPRQPSMSSAALIALQLKHISIPLSTVNEAWSDRTLLRFGTSPDVGLTK